ncbi:cytochrome b [Pseudoroseicyclus sp. H15]
MPRAADHFTGAQVLLHWLTLLVILVSFFSHDAIEDAFRHLEATGPWVTEGIVHRVAGMTILVLTLIRLFLRMRHGAPEEPPMPGMMRLAAHASHWAIYALLLLIPVVGLMAWVGGIEPAGELHGVLFWLLAIVTTLHIAAALYHQFIRKDHLLRTMMPASKAG